MERLAAEERGMEPLHLKEIEDRWKKKGPAGNGERPWRAGVPDKGEQIVRQYGYYSKVSIPVPFPF